MELLRRHEVALQGAEAVVVGRSDLVGRPLAALLLAANATVTVCHSRTRDLGEVCRRADVLVAAVGRPRMIPGDWVKPGATVIDVGINRTDDGLVGDVDFESAAERAGLITPGPRRRRADDDRDAAAQHAAGRQGGRGGAVAGGRVELSRLRQGDLVAGVGGVALLVVMFLDWYAAGGSAQLPGPGHRGLARLQRVAGVQRHRSDPRAHGRSPGSGSPSSPRAAAARRCPSPRA